jgi:hypothetical protein
VRFGGRPETATLAYSPRKAASDLECAKEELCRPTVYHLLGKLSTAPTYAISDEDLLEFICALQAEHLQPARLFDELENNHLLILGENLSDWLARFFLRAAKRRRLSDPRAVLEILADYPTCCDASLVRFLQHFSSRKRVFRGGGAVEFVEELWRRWRERNPAPPAQPPVIPPAREMPAGAVFISYARENLPAVQQLKAGLDAAGLTVWFDFDQLRAGDDWDRNIASNVRRCSCFVAVISRHTEARLEGYFRREWNYALDRELSIDPGRPFIIPVAVDDTATFAAVPERFLKRHVARLPGGRVTPEFVAHLQQIVSRSGKPVR